MYVKRITTLLIFALLALAILISYAPIHAKQSAPANRSIYIFGDSWAQQMSEIGTPTPFDQALADRSFDSFITLHKHGISGSTAAEWAANNNNSLSALVAAIVADPNPNPIAFFTLGGNDLRAGSSQTQIATNIAVILTALEGARADLRIVFGGYDILNPTVSQICLVGVQLLFGSTDPAVVNASTLTAAQGSALITTQFSRTGFVNTFGSLQGTPGNPNPSIWSPVQYVTADCLHLNSDGYAIYLNTLFAQALSPAICVDPEIVSSTCPRRAPIFLPILSK